MIWRRECSTKLVRMQGRKESMQHHFLVFLRKCRSRNVLRSVVSFTLPIPTDNWVQRGFGNRSVICDCSTQLTRSGAKLEPNCQLFTAFLRLASPSVTSLSFFLLPLSFISYSNMRRPTIFQGARNVVVSGGTFNAANTVCKSLVLSFLCM